MYRTLLGISAVVIGASSATPAPVPDAPPRPLKVLLLDGTPRWEYRQLRNRLERKAEPKLYDPRFVLFSADEEAVASDKLALRTLPGLKDLFSYDVVILGDCDATEITHEGGKNLATFVTEGGGLIVIAGPRNGIPGLDPLKPVLPVDTTGRLEQASGRKPYRPQLTAAGKKHKAFAHGSGEGQIGWEHLPEMWYWTSSYAAKPGVEILATHPTEKGADGKSHPLLLTHKHGKGRCTFIGFDGTWRWLSDPPNGWHEHFWKEMLKSVASGM